MRVRRIDGERVAHWEIAVIEIKDHAAWLQDKMGLRPIGETVGWIAGPCAATSTLLRRQGHSHR